MYPFDQLVSTYCEKMDVRYSRYADDLALSTDRPQVLERVKAFIVKSCEEMTHLRLVLNEDKTVFTSKKFQRQLTGLTLSNDGTASLGRSRKREIRSMAHHFLKNKLTPEEKIKLRGLIAFTLSIDSAYVESIRRMLGTDTFNVLMGRK